MKEFFILILISVTSLSHGCKKEAAVSDTILSEKELSGTWELRTSEGGLIPGRAYAPGNGNSLNFTASNYQKFVDGQLAKSGTYELNKEKFFSSDVLKYRIIYDGDKASAEEYAEIIDGQLKIYSHQILAADGMEYLYQKQANTNQ